MRSLDHRVPVCFAKSSQKKTVLPAVRFGPWRLALNPRQVLAIIDGIPKLVELGKTAEIGPKHTHLTSGESAKMRQTAAPKRISAGQKST